jgi:hypothetical protein
MARLAIDFESTAFYAQTKHNLSAFTSIFEIHMRFPAPNARSLTLEHNYEFR